MNLILLLGAIVFLVFLGMLFIYLRSVHALRLYIGEKYPDRWHTITGGVVWWIEVFSWHYVKAILDFVFDYTVDSVNDKQLIAHRNRVRYSFLLSSLLLLVVFFFAIYSFQ